MADFTIYHNPRCSKSRQALELLQQNGIEPQVVLYLEHPPSAAQLRAMLKKLGMGARDLLRKGEAEYDELKLADPALTDARLIELMVQYPKLIERPVVVRGERAVLGRPPENVLELLA